MDTSFTAVIKKNIEMRARRLFTLFSLAILTFTTSFGIVPNWYGGTPTVIPHVYSEDFKYGIDQPGKVYAAIANYNDVGVYTSAQIKAGTLAGPSGSRISTWVLTIAAGSQNTVFTINALNQLGGNIPLIPN